MTAINLRKDLEAMYYFGSEQFDSQRNILRDQSGYGRHAEANGGPTVGVEGPNDFEATSFDGSDDRFIFPTLSFDDGDDWTIAFFARGYNNVSNPVISDDGFANMISVTTHDEIDIEFDDNNGRTHSLADVTDLISVRVSGDSYNVLNPVSVYQESGVNTKIKFTQIGESHNKNRNFNGNIIFVGVWSRALSDAEIQYLNNLTAPVRSQL